ncbi:Zinc finger, DHHC-type, palmitoyltransferase [Parasponia andersonii]|uniref:S-acyltransferase n=1 Tax=Parasponia andersonii TaxID=3476 RepID=A0A2P5BBQ8_PARAD|nr:Zinc finger, DHHC-type, palmitoyltransferase [Parasponia andersonii]
MLELQNKREVLAWPNLIGRSLVSLNMVLITQFALSFVPRFFSNSSLLTQLSLSVLVMLVVVGFGGWFRRLLGIHASAPAFVFFNILFIWCFYVFIIRQAISLVMDIVFNGEVVLLIFGLCRILKSDPGLVMYAPSPSDKPIESSVAELNARDEELELSTSGLGHESNQGRRVRYCKTCKAYIKGFDHHCPAFGNCIGQKNYLLFMVLLVGFLVTETSFLACSSDYSAKYGISRRLSSEDSLSENLAKSTRMFAILQLVWQVNWHKYPEFQLIVQYQPGQGPTEVRFTNPYDKGDILQNVKEFLSSEG